MVSQALCSIETRVSSPTASKRTSTSVDWSAEKLACRQPKTRRLPGSHTEMRPISKVSPSSRRLIEAPAYPGLEGQLAVAAWRDPK